MKTQQSTAQAPWPRLMSAVVVLITALSLSATAFGQRATEDQMDRATKTLDEYFKDIQANYRAIDGLILKRGQADTPGTVARLEDQRRAAKSSEERATYGYLLARAYYWQGFHEFKATRNPEVFTGLRPELLAEFLAAFKDIGLTEQATGVADHVRSDIIGAFASALATNLWGANLSAGEKQQAVVEFVDVVERMPGHDKLLPSGETLARMYRNLGIEARLAAAIPKELPRDYDKLLALIDKNRKVVPPAQLLPVVEAIEREHADRLEKTPERLQTLAEIYTSNHMYDKALRLLALAASQRSQYYFDLYALGMNEKVNMPPAETSSYLDKFIAGGSSTPRGSHEASGVMYSRGDAYSRAIRCLSNDSHYQEALGLVARYEADTSFRRGVREPVDILLLKAKCLDKSGDTAAALAAYRGFIEKSANLGSSYVRIREMAEKRIAALTAQ